jgi:hypothetical protein
MKRAALLFVVSALVAGTVGAAAHAKASTTWTRTIHGASCVPGAEGSFTCPFTSDKLSGSTWNGAGGNGGVTAIFADFSVPGATPANVLGQACGMAYTGSGGGCGTMASKSWAAGVTSVDLSVPVWTGTGSQWDYFWVWTDSGVQTHMLGIGISGTD